MYMCVVRMYVSLSEGERDREGERKGGVLRVLDMMVWRMDALSSVLLPWIQQGSYCPSPR